MKNPTNDHLVKNLTIVIVLYKESFQLISKTLSTINSFKKIIIDNDNNIDLEKKIKSEFDIEKYVLNKKTYDSITLEIMERISDLLPDKYKRVRKSKKDFIYTKTIG